MVAADCNFTCDDLKAIENALAKGVKTVKYVDKEITYRSVDDMLKIRNLMRQCLGIGNNSRGTRRVAQFNKALC